MSGPALNSIRHRRKEGSKEAFWGAGCWAGSAVKPHPRHQNQPLLLSDSVRFLNFCDREVCWLGGDWELLQMCSLRRCKQQSIRVTHCEDCSSTGDSNSVKGRSAHHLCPVPAPASEDRHAAPASAWYCRGWTLTLPAARTRAQPKDSTLHATCTLQVPQGSGYSQLLYPTLSEQGDRLAQCCLRCGSVPQLIQSNIKGREEITDRQPRKSSVAGWLSTEEAPCSCSPMSGQQVQGP